VTAVAHGTRAEPAAIVELCACVLVFSLQDAVIKGLSSGYPVHEAIVIRSIAALPFLVYLVRRAGGFGVISAHGRLVLTLRGLIALTSDTTYCLALPAMPLASAVTLWFTAPLFLAALSWPIAREQTPARAWPGVAIGFAGVIVMVRPGGDLFHLAAALPVVAALMYAISQLTARRVGHLASAAVMAAYQNGVYLVGAALLAVALRPLAGGGADDPSTAFLLHAWVVPDARDLALLALCGPVAAFGSTLLSSAYRKAGSVVARSSSPPCSGRPCWVSCCGARCRASSTPSARW